MTGVGEGYEHPTQGKSGGNPALTRSRRSQFRDVRGKAAGPDGSLAISRNACVGVNGSNNRRGVRDGARTSLRRCSSDVTLTVIAEDHPFHEGLPPQSPDSRADRHHRRPVPQPSLAPLPASGHAAQVTPTASADAGLFGSRDPTYDGVYRQGLALLALDAAGGAIPEFGQLADPPALCQWSFMAYRANLRIPCSAPSSTTYSGPDTNSTALAVVALNAVRRHGETDRAAKWLVSHQNPSDGGWAYPPGGRNGRQLHRTGHDGPCGLTESARRFVRSSRARTGTRHCLPCRAPARLHRPTAAGSPSRAVGPQMELATAQTSLGLVGTVRQQRNDAGVLPVNRLTAGLRAG